MNYSEEMKLDEVRKGEREDQSLSVQFSHSVMSDSTTPWTAARQAVYGDSPGKNTGVGCHALLRYMYQFSHSVVSDSLRPHGLQHVRLPCPSPTPGAYPNSCPLSL